MKRLELNDIKVNIPDGWNEVTVAQQIEVEKLSADEPEFKSLAIIAGYCSVPMLELKKTNVNNLKKIIDAMTFINEPMKNQPVMDFEHKGIKYSVIQSLMKAETQDFLSVDGYLKQYKDREYLALPIIIAILSKRKLADGKYESIDQFDIAKRAKEFEDLPMSVAGGIWFFFAVTSKLSTLQPNGTTLKQMDEHLNKSMTSTVATLRNLAGGRWYMRLLKVILLNYVQYLQKSWKRYYTGINLDNGR